MSNPQADSKVERAGQANCFALLDLPLEIRINIFEHLFTTAPRTTLCSIYMSDRRNESGVMTGRREVLANTSPLVICKKTQDETILAFYKSHVFHFCLTTPDSIYRLYLSRQKYLRVITNIRLQLRIFPGDPCDIKWKVSKRLKYFQEQCPNLRTLTLHVLATRYSVSRLDYLIGIPEREFVDTLRSMQPKLDRMSIVTIGLPIFIRQL